MRHWSTQVGAVVVLCTLAAIGTAAQSRSGESQPAGTETPQESSQKAGAAGEAPPSDEQPTPSASKPRPAGKRQDVRDHLARIEEIVQNALKVKTAAHEPVGTAGTPLTAQSGERLVIERAQLEEIQVHLEQIRTALGGAPPAR